MKEPTSKDDVATDMTPVAPETDAPLKTYETAAVESNDKDVATIEDAADPDVAAAKKPESKGWKKAARDESSTEKAKEPVSDAEPEETDSVDDGSEEADTEASDKSDADEEVSPAPSND